MKILVILCIIAMTSSMLFAQRDTNINNSKIEIIKKGGDYEEYYHRKDENGKLFTGIDTIYFYCHYNKWLCAEDSFFCLKDKCISLLFYKNGKLIYDIAFFADGNRRFVKKYDGYMYSDTVFFWYNDGKIESIIYPFTSNQLYTFSDIPWYCSYPMISWYQSGQKKAELFFWNRYGIHTEWYPNGQLKSKSELSLDGTLNGYYKKWCENGIVVNDYLINRGKQLYIINNCDGNKIAEGYFINVEWNKVGRWRCWYSTGQLMLEEFYKDTDDPKLANYRIGTWSYWDENGNLIKQEKYKDNKLIETKEFLPKAEKKSGE